MRAICEACSKPQPIDWKAQDLCVHCGQAVRPEIRCFWCVKWTPAAGKFCRHCGAAVVEQRLYGAARMLKDAGVDRFAVPKMLKELDPDQVENFSNIYSRQAGALARHVDHVRFLEGFLHCKDWSDQVEEELIVQLPWKDDRLESFTQPLDPAERAVTGNMSREESLALARFLCASPVYLTKNLALLVRLLLEDWKVQRDAMSVLANIDPRLRGEAALALTNWRVVYGPGIHDYRYELRDALRACPFSFEAAIHLSMMGSQDDRLPEGALNVADPDLAFTAAMVAGDVDRLVAATHDERDAMKRYAASYCLVRKGHFVGLSEAIRSATAEQQADLIHWVGYAKRSAAPLRDVLFELLETSPDEKVRRAAASALSSDSQPGDTMRIARLARGHSQIYQGLLQNQGAAPEELAELCSFLLERGELKAEQWGLPDATKQGRLPPGFAPAHWQAADEESRKTLVRIAEMQLEQYGDPELHRFLANAALGDETCAVQEQAWTSLFRWYERSGQGREGALTMSVGALCFFFGSVEAFVPILTRFIGLPTPRPILKESSNRQRIERFLYYANGDIAAGMKNVPRESLDLVQALHGLLKDPAVDFMIQQGAIKVMVILASVPEVRPAVERILNRCRGTNLDLASTEALARITSS